MRGQGHLFSSRAHEYRCYALIRKHSPLIEMESKYQQPMIHCSHFTAHRTKQNARKILLILPVGTMQAQIYPPYCTFDMVIKAMWYYCVFLPRSYA